MKKLLNTAKLTKGIVALVLVMASVLASAQTCTPQVKSNGIWSTTGGVFCQGDLISFEANSPGFSSSSNTWNFGDGIGTSSQEKPSYIYTTAGTYTVTYSGTGSAGSCTGGKLTIIVRPSPEIHVRQLKNDTQCFAGNQFCFRDSIVAPQGSVKRIRMVFSDGTDIDTVYPAGGVGKLAIYDFCVTMKDPTGGFFNMVIEAYDTSGCFTKITFTDYIYVHPKLGIQFNNITPLPNPGCDSTLGVFLNTSGVNISDVDTFFWHFGDGFEVGGTKNYNQKWWFGDNSKDTIKHMYTTNGSFNGSLTVTAYGCTETFNWKNAVTNYVVDPKIVSTPNPACVAQNPIEFSLTNFNPVGVSSFLWNFGDPPSGPANTDFRNLMQTSHGYGPGPWMISLRIQQGPCDVTIYDTVQVIGPISTVEVAFNRVDYNQTYQCLITDSIQMVNNSSYYQNDYNRLDEDSIVFYYEFSFDYDFDKFTGVRRFIVREWEENKFGNFVTFADSFPATDTINYKGHKVYYDNGKDSIARIFGGDTVWQKELYAAYPSGDKSWRNGVNGLKRWVFNYTPPPGGKGVGAGNQTAIPPTLDVRDYNPNVWRVWSFGDRFAPQCTTDSRPWVNRNVGVNCNWSIDSVPIHWYTPWDDIYRLFRDGENYLSPKVEKRLFKEDTLCYEVNVFANTNMVVPRIIYINVSVDSTDTFYLPYDGLDPTVYGYRDTIKMLPGGAGYRKHFKDSTHQTIFQQETYVVVCRPQSRWIGTEFYYNAAKDSFYAVNNLTDTTVLAADPLGRGNKTAGNGTTRWSTTISEMSFFVPAGVTITTVILPAPGGGGTGLPSPGPSYTGPRTIVLPANTQFTLKSKDSLFTVKHIQTVARNVTPATASSFPYKDAFGKTRFASKVFVDSALHRECWFLDNAACFQVELWQKDTIHPLKCESTGNKSLALIPPSAKGLEWVAGTPCPFTPGKNNYILQFDMANTKPGCTQNWFAVNYDTLLFPPASTASWNVFNGGGVLAPPVPGSAIPFGLPYIIGGNVGTQFVKGYSPGQITNVKRTPSGSFAVGLIVGNGALQPNGIPSCLDTAYYPDMFRILYMNAGFTMLGDPSYVCAGSTVYFKFDDPIQDSISTLRWNWGYPGGSIARGPQQGGYYEQYYYYEEYKGPVAGRNDENVAYNGEKWLYNFIERYNIDDFEGTKLIDTIVVSIIKDWQVVAIKRNISKDIIELFDAANLSYQDLPAEDIPYYLGDGSNGCVDTTGLSNLFTFGIKAYHQSTDSTVWQVGNKRYRCLGFNPVLRSDTTFFKNGSGNRVPSMKYPGVDSFLTVQDVPNYNKNDCVSSKEVTEILHFRDSSVQGYDTAWMDIDNDGTIDMITGVYKHTFKYRVRQYPDPCDSTVVDTVYKNANGYMTPNAFLTNRTGCEVRGGKLLNVGFFNRFWLDDDKVCEGLTLYVRDSIRYYQLGEQDPQTYPLDQSPFPPRWKDPVRFANGLEDITWDWDSTDGVWDNEKSQYGSHLYTVPGKYTVTAVPKDETICRDTTYLTVYISKLDADMIFKDSVVNCASIVDFKDASTLIDPCAQTCPNGKKIVCDSIISWDWDFDDGTRNSKLQDPSHNYTSSGEYDVKLTVKTLLGCDQTIIKRISIPGPQPEFEFDLDSFNLNDTAIVCVGDSLFLQNLSKGDQINPVFNMNWGDSSVVSISLTSTKFGHAYKKAGTYHLFLSQQDDIPGTTQRCTRMFPDTSAAILNPRHIVVIVRPNPDVDITADKDTVCVGELITFTATMDSRYTRLKWYMAGTDTISKVVPDTTLTFGFPGAGVYSVILRPEYDILPRCWDKDTHTVVVQDVTADFDINDAGRPNFCFTNLSTSTIGSPLTYKWTFEDTPLDGESNLKDPCYNWDDRVNTWEVCLSIIDQRGCKDTICKDIENTFSKKLVPYNIFTPNADGLNDEFVVEGKSLKEFEIKIFNRWGELMFESKDVNVSWNGKVKNTGNICPEATYFYVIKYIYEFTDKQEIIEGSVDILRD